MILAIADDFAGAAEIAGIGHGHGLRSMVGFEFPSGDQPDLLVIDSNSRSMDRENAAEAIADVARRIKQNAVRPVHVFKKIDSVLRGPVLAETESLMTALGLHSAVVVAGNPASGRVVRDGRLLIKGTPLHRTGFAADPEYPAHSSSALELLGTGKHSPRLANPGDSLDPGVAVANAASVADLATWADTVSPETLPAGGAAFFNALLPFWVPRGQGPNEQFPLRGSRLYVCGSACADSRNSIWEWRRAGVGVAEMPAAHLGSDMDELAIRWAEEAQTILRLSGQAVLTIGTPGGDGSKVTGRFAVRTLPLPPLELAAIMGAAASHVIRKIRPAHVVIEGGGTSSVLLYAMGWSPLEVLHEHAPGVTTLRLAAGRGPTVTVKPGSYPWPAALCPRSSR